MHARWIKSATEAARQLAPPYSTLAGSGVPNVGAPVCIDIELAKLPKMTGAPGLTAWVKAIPLIASASV